MRAPSSELSPVQSGLRFLIEVAALVSWGIVGWHLAGAPLGWLCSIALPVAGAAMWATLRVPGDASADGGAPIAVPGPVRLLLEVGLLLGAAIAVGAVGQPSAGIALATAFAVHSAATTSRIRWLIARR